MGEHNVVQKKSFRLQRSAKQLCSLLVKITQKLLGKTHIETSQRAVRMNRAVDRTHLILTLLLQGLGITGTNQSAGRRSRRTRATRTQRPRRKRRQPTIYVLLEHNVVQKKSFRLQRSAKQLCSLLVKIT